MRRVAKDKTVEPQKEVENKKEISPKVMNRNHSKCLGKFFHAVDTVAGYVIDGSEESGFNPPIAGALKHMFENYIDQSEEMSPTKVAALINDVADRWPDLFNRVPEDEDENLNWRQLITHPHGI
mgnify:FL=1|tara:strand:- start:756 stop:1127 length:372 start_codon:yes stop_codon:yes gene_type:complete